MSGDKSDRQTIELAALYAAGALGADEHAEVDARLASGDEALRAAIRSFSGAIEGLAAAVPAIPPRPQVLEQLLDRIASSADPEGAPVAAALRSADRDEAPLVTAEQAGTLVVLRAESAQWKRMAKGVEVRTLFVNVPARRVTLVARLAPGTTYPAHFHLDDEECLMLEGDLRVGDFVLGPGDYQRAPEGSWHGEQRTESGCVCLIIAPLSTMPVASE